MREPRARWTSREAGLATVTSMTISRLWVKNRHHNEIFDSLARRSSSLLMNILAGRLNRDDQVTQPESVSTTGSFQEHHPYGEKGRMNPYELHRAGKRGNAVSQPQLNVVASSLGHPARRDGGLDSCAATRAGRVAGCANPRLDRFAITSYRPCNLEISREQPSSPLRKSAFSRAAVARC